MSINLVLIAISTLFGACEKTSTIAPDSSDLKNQIISTAELNHIPTLSVYIKSNDRILNFQYQDKDKSIETISYYGLASTTKFLSAILILRQIEENKLGLNDLISKYVDRSEFQNINWFDSITIKNLLNHTSGIPDYTKNASWINSAMSANPPSNYTEKMQLINFSDSTYKFGQFTYSNSNFVILEKIIEIVNNNNAKEIFDDFYSSIGLPNISFKSPKKTSQAFFAQQENQISNVSSWEENYGFEGGAYASINDLITILKRLFINKDILKQQSLDSMTLWTDLNKFQINYVFAKMTNYGLGLMKYEFNGRTFIGHAGSSLKYQSFVFIEPTTGSEIVLLTNCSGKYYNHTFFIDILGVIVKGL